MLNLQRKRLLRNQSGNFSTSSLKELRRQENKPEPRISREDLERLKTEFQENLTRLDNNDTKKVGLERCEKIITNNTDPLHLRMYLSQLCVQANTLKIQRNKELQVILLGHVANTFQNGMLDPIDKPPSICKTISRV